MGCGDGQVDGQGEACRTFGALSSFPNPFSTGRTNDRIDSRAKVPEPLRRRPAAPYRRHDPNGRLRLLFRRLGRRILVGLLLRLDPLLLLCVALLQLLSLLLVMLFNLLPF